MSPRALVVLVVALAACRHGDAVERRAREAKAHRIVQLDAGPGFACARLRSGEVRCWGDNHRAQLGDGTLQRREQPQPVAGLSDAIHLSIEGDSACAVRKNGTVMCWGRRVPSKEPGTTRKPVALHGMPRARQVALSTNHVHVLAEGGEVWSIANLPDARPQETVVRDVVELVASGTDVCARTKDGLVRCWAPNPTDCSAYGIACTAAPGRDLGLGDVVEIEMQEARMCARRKDGTVWCTHREQRCTPVADDRGVTQPRKVAELAKATELIGTSCARVEGGAPWCWDDSPLRATGEDTCRASAALVSGFSKVHAIAGSPQHGCFALDDEISCWSTRAEMWGGEPVTLGSLHWTRIEGLDGPAASIESPLAGVTAELAKRPVAGFAYVWDNAEWYTDARGATIGRLADFADDERFTTRTGRTPVRIVTEAGDRVEFRTLGGRDELHCDAAGHDDELRDYELRAFVRKRDLVPVLPKSYSVGYADGTGVTVSAGSVVRPVAANEWVVDRGVELPVELELDDVALSYARVKPQTTRGHDTGWIAESATVRLDGHRLAQGSELAGFALVSRNDSNTGALVQLTNRCVSMRVLVPPDAVRAGGGGGMGTIGNRSQHTWTIRADAKAYWQDGHEAGRTVRARTTTDRPLIADGRMCFTVRAFTICHDPGDVTEE